MREIRVVTKAEGMFNEPKVETIEHSLANMQKLVTPEGHTSALIERVYIAELAEQGIDFYVNEEGKFNGCKPNFSIFRGRDVAYGPVFFCSSDDEGETVGLSDAQVKFVMDWINEQPQAIPL
jgi:hypothetical protein